MFPIKRMGRHIDITYPVNVILNYIAELEHLSLDVTHTRSAISSSGETVDLDVEIKNAGTTSDETRAKLHTKIYIGTPKTKDIRTERVGVVALEMSNAHGAEYIDLVSTAFPTMKDATTTIPELASVVSREFDVYTFNRQLSQPHRFPGSD